MNGTHPHRPTSSKRLLFFTFFSEKQFFSGSYQVLLGFLSGSTRVIRFFSGSTRLLRFYSGSTQVLLRFFSGSSRVLLRFLSAQNKFAQTSFGRVLKIEMDVLQTSNTTPLGIGRFWRVYFTISRFLCFWFFSERTFAPFWSPTAKNRSRGVSEHVWC